MAQSSASAFLVSNTAGTVTVMPAPLTITTASRSNGYVGSAYAAILAASGGNGTHSWVVTWGTLPDGLSLDLSTGVVSGTPTSSGTSNSRGYWCYHRTRPSLLDQACQGCRACFWRCRFLSRNSSQRNGIVMVKTRQSCATICFVTSNTYTEQQKF